VRAVIPELLGSQYVYTPSSTALIRDTIPGIESLLKELGKRLRTVNRDGVRGYG